MTTMTLERANEIAQARIDELEASLAKETRRADVNCEAFKMEVAENLRLREQVANLRRKVTNLSDEAYEYAEQLEALQAGEKDNG